MVALPLHKEQPGSIVNSLLAHLLSAATDLLVNEVADMETIVAYLKGHIIDAGTLTALIADRQRLQKG